MFFFAFMLRHLGVFPDIDTAHNIRDINEKF